MLATILLLAQIVQSWPGLDSPLVQPGPTICVGEYAGPVVLGPAERGRLVVACDMRSDTCSDGRKITTTRPTPVPCEVSPGVWEMVPANTACISYRGLESWAANTSYLSYGAELGRSPWVSGGAPGHVVRVYDVEGVNRMCQEAPLSPTSPAGRYQFPLVPTEAGTNTLSCIARPNTGSNIRLIAGNTSQIAIFPMVPGWARYTHSTEVEEGHQSQISVYTLGQTCIDIAGCWLTRTSIPGRACWDGEAPVTCAADRHTISTEGWPTESGEISVTYTPQDVGVGSGMYMAATTASGEGRPSGFYLYRISATGALVFGLRRGDTVSAQNTQDLVWEDGRSYHIRVRWSPERAEIWRDGVLLRSWVPTVVPDSHPDVAYIGVNIFGGNPAQGSIRSLTVRSYEEVSP